MNYIYTNRNLLALLPTQKYIYIYGHLLEKTSNTYKTSKEPYNVSYHFFIYINLAKINQGYHSLRSRKTCKCCYFTNSDYPMPDNFSCRLYNDVIIENKKNKRERNSTYYMFTDVLNISNIEDRSDDQLLFFITYNDSTYTCFNDSLSYS